MNERNIRWWTPHTSRDFEMLVFGDACGLPLVLFPTSFGRYSQNKDFGLIECRANNSSRVRTSGDRLTADCADVANNLGTLGRRELHFLQIRAIRLIHG